MKKYSKLKIALYVSNIISFIAMIILIIFALRYGDSFMDIIAVIGLEIAFFFFTLIVYHLTIISGALRHQSERLDEQDKKLEEALKPHHAESDNNRGN